MCTQIQRHLIDKEKVGVCVHSALLEVYTTDISRRLQQHATPQRALHDLPTTTQSPAHIHQLSILTGNPNYSNVCTYIIHAHTNLISHVLCMRARTHTLANAHAREVWRWRNRQQANF